MSYSQLECHVYVIFSENLKLMSSVGADERDAPAISVRNAPAAVAHYAIASRDRCRLTGEWLRNAYADFVDNSSYPTQPVLFTLPTLFALLKAVGSVCPLLLLNWCCG